MKIIIVTLGLLLSGCSLPKSLTTEQQAAGIAVCQKAHLYAQVRKNEMGQVLRIDCDPMPSYAQQCPQSGGVPIVSGWTGALANCIYKNK